MAEDPFKLTYSGEPQEARWTLKGLTGTTQPPDKYCHFLKWKILVAENNDVYYLISEFPTNLQEDLLEPLYTVLIPWG